MLSLSVCVLCMCVNTPLYSSPLPLFYIRPPRLRFLCCRSLPLSHTFCCVFFLCCFHSLLPTADLQRATPYTCGACCCGDLDRQGSHPHKCEAAGTAAWFLQVPAAKHQAPCRFCAATLVSSPFGGWTDRLGWSLLFWFCSDGSTLCLLACN